ncbi:MAG: hypothetical protein Q4D34_00065 [Eggerthellaceae bacterium]|nr:hypothetical protein [Eggerthellaceae bacterium]
MQAISVQRIIVRKDRVVCYVALDPHAPRATTPEIAQRLIRRVSSLPDHDCINEKGPTFGDVIDQTSIPHVLEHLVIDFQAQQAAQSLDARMRARSFRGTTEWINVSEGRAKIELDYADDLVVLKALTDSVDILNDVLLP